MVISSRFAKTMPKTAGAERRKSVSNLPRREK
jgi:hypothetical protein